MAFTVQLGAVDVTRFVRVSPGDGLDPTNTSFDEPQFADSPISDGAALIQHTYGNREHVYPLFVNDTSKDNLHRTVVALTAEAAKTGVQLEYRDDGATSSTFFDVEAAKFDPDYNFRRGQKLRVGGNLRVWTRPFGHSGTMRIAATSAGSSLMVTAPLGVIDGDRPAQLEGYVRAGSTVPTYGLISALGVANPSRTLMIPAASLTTLAGALATRIADAAVPGGFAIEQPWATPSPAVTVALSPASLYEGRQRVLAVARRRTSFAPLIHLSKDGLIVNQAQATSFDFVLHDLGAITIPPQRVSTYTFDVGVVSGPGYAGYGVLPLGNPNRALATAPASGGAQIAGIFVLPEDSTVLTVDEPLQAVDGFHASQMGQGRLYDMTGPRGVGFAIAGYGLQSYNAGSALIGIASLGAGIYQSYGNYLTAGTAARPMRVRANGGIKTVAASNAFGVLKAVDNYQRISAQISGSGLLAVKAASTNGALTTLTSSQAPSTNLSVVEVELRTGLSGDYSAAAWDVNGKLLASTAGSAAIVDFSGYPGLAITGLSANSQTGVPAFISSFDGVTGAPRADNTARDYLRYSYKEGVQRGGSQGDPRRDLAGVTRGRVPMVRAGSAPAVAFGVAINTEGGTLLDVLDLDVRVRERWTYLR